MKRFIRLQKQVLAGILCVALVQCPVFLLFVSGAEQSDGLHSTGAVLMDGNSGRILFSKNGKEINEEYIRKTVLN